MPLQRIEYLFDKYVSNTCSPEEESEFFSLLQNPEHKITLEDRMLTWVKDVRSGAGLAEEPRADILQAILLSDKKEIKPRIHILKQPWLRYAAAVILLAGTLWYLNLYRRPAGETAQTSVLQQPELTPGGNKAVLTLADGTAITLDSTSGRSIGLQGNTQIIKVQDGQLAYKSAEGQHTNEIMYNTISTPRKGQYQVLLPDGTTVWLNALSSIRFPTSFEGKTRKVEVKGEVYMEVADNKKMPFIVSVNGLEVYVLGTSFNINAYSDESAIKTTLAEGSIKVSQDGKEIMLKPGEQVQVSNEIIRKEETDVSAVIAWKNGLFTFNDASIEDIMRQLSRWYDFEVTYEGKVNDRFRTIIPRNAAASQVLRVLESTKAVHFEIKGNKVIVRP